MRREYEAVQAAKATQEDEMRALKDRMMLGVSKLCVCVCVRACDEGLRGAGADRAVGACTCWETA